MRMLHSFPVTALVAVTAFVIVALPACGKSSGGPTAASPTIRSLTIDGPEAVPTGVSTQYTATAGFSNGTTQTVTATWTITESDLASVDGNGRVTGLDHGGVTVSASHEGLSASRSIRIVHNFGGSWSGTYVIRACDQSGVFREAGWCQQMTVGSILPMALDLDQTGIDCSQASGTLALGTIAGNVSGHVTSSGVLNLGGSFDFVTGGLVFTLTIGGWDTALTGDHAGMTGRWAQNLTTVAATGNAYQENEVVSLTRTSSTATIVRVPESYRLTFGELFSRLKTPR